MNKEGMQPETPLFNIEKLSAPEKDLHFAMQSNGYYLSENGNWVFIPETAKAISEEFKGQSVSFFGPSPLSNFFSNENPDYARFLPYFKRDAVTNVIGKYRRIDEDLAVRIAFILGGMVRQASTTNAIDFVSKMTMLGEKRSGDAIASAMAMYVLSNGSLDNDNNFKGDVYHMGEAVRNDPVVTSDTKDLGLSQVARLRAFSDLPQLPYIEEFDVKSEMTLFDEFPTVGAEFHFSPDAAEKYPDFWKRLAILNMSQYQKGSYIQLSRNDRDVIEVRMNPSLYPITIANWEYMRRILPELDDAFFTVTLNKQNNEDFIWVNDEHKTLISRLHAIGMLIYAGMFENNPRIRKSEEIDFGSVYLGQTVKMQDGKYEFTGNWGGGPWGGIKKEGSFGQIAIYTGFGDAFPRFAYYLSMVFANPDITRFLNDNFLPNIKTLNDALAVWPSNRISIFRKIQDRIGEDERLRKASESGNRIIESLSPQATK